MLDSIWTYIGIAMSLFLTGIGLPPLPEELPIIAAGVLARSGQAVWWLAWPSCIIGIVTCDMVLYALGRFWGHHLFRIRWIARFISPERRQHIEEGFHRHGVKILLTARLLPGVRAGIFMTAGAMRYPFARFLVADGLYAIPGVGFIFAASFFLTNTVYWLVEEVHKVQYWLLALAILAAAGYGAYRYWRFLKERSATDDFQPPSIPDIVQHPSKILHLTEHLKAAGHQAPPEAGSDGLAGRAAHPEQDAKDV
jgi:membrane protein DedA with SNARE-associated domain